MCTHARVNCTKYIIQQHDVRISKRCPGERNPLLLAARVSLPPAHVNIKGLDSATSY